MYSRLSSFDDVAKAYENIKPLRGARAKEDLRPLRQRRYWWNRVMKVNENKYILLDGHWAWSGATDEMRETTAPIVWERKDDGDYITIRNHFNEGISVSRYTFLQNHLPKDLYFHYENGKHFVRHHVNGQDHYLPKSKCTIDWGKQTMVMHKDHKVVFKHENGQFVRANELQPYKTRRVDKEMDAIYKPKVAELYDWMQIVLPMLGETIVSGRGSYADKLTDGRGYSFYYWTTHIEPEEVRAILDDPEHEKRTALAVCLANEVDALSANRFDPKHNTLSEMYKRVRRIAGLYAVEQR